MKKILEKTKYILFDFDGVIADSFAVAFEVNNMICPHVTHDDYRRAFEGNVNDWKEPFHTDDCRRDLDFFKEYVPKMKKEVKVFDGMLEVIENLSRNYTLIIISSTVTSPIKEFMIWHNKTQCFAEIMGNDVHKSKAEKIKMVFSKYKINNQQCLFITDTLGDIKEASHMGVDTIAVTWGFHNEITLAKGNPLAMVKGPDELVGAINNYFGRM